MTLDSAYRILRLSNNATHSDLVSAYRKLVKRYHPDYNSNRHEWSHNAMTKINLAYELITTHLDGNRAFRGSRTDGSARNSTAARSGAEERPDAGRSSEWRFREEMADAFSQTPAEDPAFVALFDKAADLVLGGIYTYYQYGLQNVYLRHEGVRRFRYRTAVKRVRDGVEQLQQIEHLATAALRRDQLSVFTEFAAAFLRNMLIDKYHVPTGNGPDDRADRHYHTGSDNLDAAIRWELFEELRQMRSANPVAGGLKIGYHEFMTVLISHSRSGWIPETVLKLQLLEAFTKVAARRHGV